MPHTRAWKFNTQPAPSHWWQAVARKADVLTITQHMAPTLLCMYSLYIEMTHDTRVSLSAVPSRRLSPMLDYKFESWLWLWFSGFSAMFWLIVLFSVTGTHLKGLCMENKNLICNLKSIIKLFTKWYPAPEIWPKYSFNSVRLKDI